MSESKNRISLFSRLKLRSDRDPLKVEPRPKHDWQWLLTLAFLLLVFMFTGYYFFFRQVADQRLAPAETATTTQPILSKKMIEQLAREIDQRAADSSRYLENRPTTTDPAL